MRQNIRKILALLVLVLTVFSLTACGNAAVSNEELPYDQETFEIVADTLISYWNGMSKEQIESYIVADDEDVTEWIKLMGEQRSAFGCFTADSLQEAFAAYESSMEDLGVYVSTEEYEEPVVKGDKVTFVTNLSYENREASLSIVFNMRGIVQSVTLDPKYSTGEILQKAGMNTILGMGTVFAVLIFISLVIYCFNFIPNIQAALSPVISRIKAVLFFSKKKEAPKKEEHVQTAVRKPAHKIKPASQTRNLTDDTELVAAITAAICAYTGTASDGFVVRSIRRADVSTWKRI